MIRFIAHRGDGTHYIGNTIPALLKSLELPEVVGVELDIRMTKDKHLVIFHDFLINDKNLPIRKISSLTLEEVKAYKLQNQDVHVDTLEAFLKQVNTHKKILIEIKEEGNEYREFLEVLDKLLKRYPELHFFICSFNYSLMKYFQKNYPNYKTGLIIGNFLNATHLYNSFDFVSLTMDYLNEWNFSKDTYFWTINKESDVKKIKKRTQHQVFVITDKPVELNAYLDSLSE